MPRSEEKLHACSMTPLLDAFSGALGLIASGDRALLQIVLLSLGVSLAAVVLATLIGLPLGAAVAVARFPGRQAVLVVMNALMGLPPVVVGLVVYLLLSRAGPLGPLGLLFTPPAMVIAQTHPLRTSKRRLACHALRISQVQVKATAAPAATNNAWLWCLRTTLKVQYCS